MFLVANLVTYYAMKDRAAKFGMIGESLAKNEIVLQGGLKSLEICKRHGIPVAYGSDLLGELHWDQSKEFTIRQEVVSPIEIIRSATTIGADVLRMPGKVGTLQAGRLCRRHRGRRRSAEGPCAAWRSGQTSVPDHEGRDLA